MAIQHIVLSKFKPSTTPADQKKVFQTATEYLSAIPQVKKFVVGPPLSPAHARGYNFGMAVTFEDAAALQGYIQHEKHVALVKAIGPYTQDMLAYQIDTSTGQAKL
ncbi:hypothetical protein K474DRAFT_1663665 [Panus rudis PR-1116 ss-1]|nr:hypothetical protein K474DRAFT_1663665 [Panus rudis PR-1116 ss-1]